MIKSPEQRSYSPDKDEEVEQENNVTSNTQGEPEGKGDFLESYKFTSVKELRDYRGAKELEDWKSDVNRGETISIGLVIEQLHRLKPKAIFLTQTSSIPYGIAVKEAYRTIYQEEEQPKFLTIDVKPVRACRNENDENFEIAINLSKNILKKPLTRERYSEILFWHHPSEKFTEEELEFKNVYRAAMEEKAETDAIEIIEEIKKKIKAYGIQSGDGILLMDEQTPDDPVNQTDATKKRPYAHMGTIGIAYKILEGAAQAVDPGIKIDWRYIGDKKLFTKDDGSIAPWARPSMPGKIGAKKYPTRRYEGPEERVIVKENYDYFKNIGREAGERIKKEMLDETGIHSEMAKAIPEK